MAKTVLVAIDVSQDGAVAAMLDVAQTLAAGPEDRMVLLTVVEELPIYVAARLPSDIHEKAERDALAALERIKETHGLADTTKVLIRKGHPSRTILDAAEEIGCDVVVLASHDPGPADYLLGSVAGRVVRYARCSVHVVRRPNP